MDPMTHQHDALCDPEQCPPSSDDQDYYLTVVLPDIDEEDNRP